MEPSTQLVQARVIVSELVACGVKQFFLCPGNQSSVIAAALAENSSVQVEYHFDERSACFMALGYAKASMRPAVVVCTSGSAVANLYPAILEASYAQVPLIALTADRPDELQSCAANQTFGQANFFSKATRWSYEVSAPQAEITNSVISSIRSSIDFAVYKANAHPPGPVHINAKFRKPFFSQTIDEPNSSENHTAQCRYTVSTLMPAESEIRKLASVLNKSKRGLIYVGELNAMANRELIEQLAEKLGWPIWSSVLSGMRRPEFSGLTLSHWYLGSSNLCKELRPDVVLQLGFEAPKPGNAVLNFIEQSGINRICISEYFERQDPMHRSTQRIEAEPSSVCAQLIKHVALNTSEILSPLAKAEKVTQEMIAKHCSSDRLSELAIVREVCLALTAEQQLYIANSLPIRLADYAAKVARSDIYCNRGLSGIDGLVSSAIGAAIATKKPSVILSGDLSFLYDLNVLAWLSRRKLPISIVIINNDGGQIFSVVDKPNISQRFEQLMRTPHGMQFSEIATWAGAKYFSPESMTEFRQLISSEFVSDKLSIIETRMNPDAVSEEIKQLKSLIESSVLVES